LPARSSEACRVAGVSGTPVSRPEVSLHAQHQTLKDIQRGGATRPEASSQRHSVPASPEHLIIARRSHSGGKRNGPSGFSDAPAAQRRVGSSWPIGAGQRSVRNTGVWNTLWLNGRVIFHSATPMSQTHAHVCSHWLRRFDACAATGLRL
jgi:hypothetical protein